MSVPANSNSNRYWTRQRKNGYMDLVNERLEEDRLMEQWWKQKNKKPEVRKGAKGYK